MSDDVSREMDREASRQRALASIDRVNATLDAPRSTGPLRELPAPEPAPYRPAPAPARVAPPAPAKPLAWQRALGNMEAAIGSALGLQRRAAEWRFTELERRCAEFELRLAKMETKAGGSDA